jgi:phytol kinase
VAAAVPAINAARLGLVGAGAVLDPGLVKSTSRSGDRRELLGGPFYYCLVIIASTLLFWRDSPAGLIAIAMMAGGDGLADIVGRRCGRGNALPWNPDKSWAGCGGMALGGAAMAMG